MNSMEFEPDQALGTWQADGAPPAEERTVMVTQSRAAPVADARASWVHYLVVLDDAAGSGPERSRRVPVGSTTMRIGRRVPCELVLADSEVSGLHCEVKATPGLAALEVTDRGSTNGSFIDGVRVAGTALLPSGSLLQIGRLELRHEFRPPHEAERSDELQRDLDSASRYVQSLLPPPMREGPVRTEWFFRPSAQLGGDAFGYAQIDEHRFAGYLIDVSGHGVAAAVHTVSILNVLRQRALPGVDFADPAQVLTRLNAMFDMALHGGLFFTIWYGSYDLRTRRLRYASGGHHPAFLVDAERRALRPLRTRNPVVGAAPGRVYTADEVEVDTGACLHVFSDGVYEIETAAGVLGSLADFTPLLLEPPQPGLPEPERLHRAVRSRARPGPLADDFSLLSVTFLS
ncbi:FHA domain-containing protein [Rubrivivax sp. A210]|uniref:PP2C family protein-serine/threonine phosphatase n=1 Tax=Rubrivivax sp. A210 TaxID=2772301 RepID=UPI0019191E2D|nr:SpoIIE family protein phosphatase [Rubrivivax sp. A210]CAD5375092.1 FHA domain-containing protein [Rubrivivax sp. A210]